MSGEIKLHKKFQDLLRKVGTIRTAWFTTYNFDISFFEKYVLSAIAGMPPTDIRGPTGFEILNDKIVKSKDGKIDVKVFHDFRAMQAKKKHTCIQTIGVNPKKIDDMFSHGVFHPKVALLINDKNQAWLITGSANLTISGWSRNSEGVIIEEIKDKKNAQSVTDFFLGLLQRDEEREQLEELNLIWQKKLRKRRKWKFLHSISKDLLLDELESETAEMLVWSPYFSEALDEIISSHLPWVSNLKIIPDFTSSGSIRMSPEAIEKTCLNPAVEWNRDLHDYKEVEELFVHAKIWLTLKKLAIGSWNFTEAGLNISKSNRNNIEAGICKDIKEDSFQELKSNCQLKAMDTPKGMNEDKLEKEAEGLLHSWKISCQVYADWATFKYQLIHQEESDSSFFIDLPGKEFRLPLLSLASSEVLFVDEKNILLKNRIFSVYDKKVGGEKVYSGILIELNPKQRPYLRFENLSDWTEGWLDQRPENKPELSRLINGSDNDEEFTNAISNELKRDYSNAWFSTFLAFEQLRIRIIDANLEELDQVGYCIPGSVSQLPDLFEPIKKELDSEESEITQAFCWFMINEGNQAIKLFNDKYKEKKGAKPEIQQIENIKLNFKGLSKSKVKKWTKFITRECEKKNDKQSD